MDLNNAICNYGQLGVDALPELKGLVEKYPYFQIPRLLYLSILYRSNKAEFKGELHDSAIYITDRRGLHSLLMEDSPAGRDNYTVATDSCGKEEESKEGKRSFSLIDDFLAEYGEQSTGDDRVVPETKPDKEVATDYTSYLENMDAGNDGGGESTETDASVPFSPRPIPKKAQVQEETVQLPVDSNENLSDNCFTETLAKIYVKQGKYSKALEIIQRLYLRNPNKNVYFADQIRYLEKLLINSRNQKNKIK